MNTAFTQVAGERICSRATYPDWSRVFFAGLAKIAWITKQ